ncbi:LCI fold-containing protein [Bacillus nakamurai]
MTGFTSSFRKKDSSKGYWVGIYESVDK